MEYLQQLDWQLFQWINARIANDLFDMVLPWLRNKYFWIPAYGFIISFFIFNWRARGVLITFYLFLVFFCCDSFSSRILKPTFERNRPCNEPEHTEFVILRVNCSGGYSFPSSHAVNHAGISLFLFLFFRKLLKNRAGIFLIWAILPGFAQIYVGVHYPLDVISGFIIGGLIGKMIFLLFKQTDQLLYKKAMY